MGFLSATTISDLSWQAFERSVVRLLLCEGFSGVRLVGQSRDRGADVLAHVGTKRWLIQAKHWRRSVGIETLDDTVRALQVYRAQVPVLVSLSGFSREVWQQKEILHREGIPLQLWDRSHLIERVASLQDVEPVSRAPSSFSLRPYQESGVQDIVGEFLCRDSHRALAVLATGLGKTVIAAEFFRRAYANEPIKAIVVAHTNDLVYQLERAFWPFLKPTHSTAVWNGIERPTADELEKSDVAFCCLPTLAEATKNGYAFDDIDLMIIDECHHAGASMYDRIIGESRAGTPNGPFLLGLTATPWRSDEADLRSMFGDPLVCIDLVAGMQRGFLSHVDYRMFTDNIDWTSLRDLRGNRFSPKQINRTLFINQWDDAVVSALQQAWTEQRHPRAIVFCGTIDHAQMMSDRINALGFCNAAAVYSQGAGRVQLPHERNRILADFHDGHIQVVCAVDIFNEGIDVPDVNIIVFQRVTHSRRIFVQQLGRGLRLAPDKDKVIVLDFVSDIRRFAAGLDLKSQLAQGTEGHSSRPKRVSMPHSVTFRRLGGEDPEGERFLREWLEDVAAVEAAGDDASVLMFPPPLPGGR